jgi:hypothetical protein
MLRSAADARNYEQAKEITLRIKNVLRPTGYETRLMKAKNQRKLPTLVDRSKLEPSGRLRPGGFDEEILLHGDADRLDPEGGRLGRGGRRAVPQARHQHRDLLQLEIQVRRLEGLGAQAYQRA